jgi:hypothetical protein
LQGNPKSNFEGHCISAKNKILVFLWNSGSSMFFNSLAEMILSQFGTCRKVGLQKFRFHDLRHTFDSLLIQAGVSSAYVQKQMGHRSIQVTIDVYGHLIPGENVAWIDTLDSTPKKSGGNRRKQDANGEQGIGRRDFKGWAK